MADLLEDLENLEKITTKKIISNYENAKGFISGSFEEHILMTLGSLTHGQRGYSAVNYSQILDQKSQFLNFNKIVIQSINCCGQIFNFIVKFILV